MVWKGEKQRHSLSARGIQTRRYGLIINGQKRPKFFDSRKERTQFIKREKLKDRETYTTFHEDIHHPIFNKKNRKKYLEEDLAWNDNLKFLVLKHKAKAAVFGPVVVYCNYIPLFRPTSDESFFEEAEPNTLYVWNMNDLPEKSFELWAAKVKKAVPDMKIELVYDPGGA